MSTQTKSKEKTETPSSESQRHFQDISRKVLLAGIGAAALAQDEAEAFVNRLVERGEMAQKDGQGLLNELMDKRKKHLAKMEAQLTQRAEKMLERLNIPTKQEMDALHTKIAELNQKLDRLNRKPDQ
jgi:poly(hydroxyalkanoate) granule-associated protein